MPIGASKPLTASSRVRGHGHRREGSRFWADDDEALLSRCWCDRVFLRVPADLVRRNLTFPCELDTCVRIAREHGWKGPDGVAFRDRTPIRRGALPEKMTPEQMSRFYEE